MTASRLKTSGRGRKQSNSNQSNSRRSGLTARRTSALIEHHHRGRNGSFSQEERLASGLGWFGIGLGLAELLVPRRLARAIGVSPQHRRLIRMMGVREIASGVGIILLPGSATAVWSRVAGDVMDLACLGAAFTSFRPDRGRLATAFTAVAGVTALDLLCAQQLARGVQTHRGLTPVTVTLTINRAPHELYAFWRNFSNLPQCMKHLMSVKITDERRSHWVATGPAGSTIEWDAEITEDRPHELIAWRSLEPSDVEYSGVIRFEPASGARGTMVTVEMDYRPPAGTLGSAVSAWFGDDPHESIRMDLRRFKQLMETGEVITTEGQPAGRARAVRHGDTIAP
jgi:uncharacterized membrane protein